MGLVASSTSSAVHVQSSSNVTPIEQQKQQLIIDVIYKLGETVGLLRAEKIQLESENRKLQNDVSQLTSVQIAELNSAVDNNQAKRELIVQKLKTIVQKFEEISRTILTHCGGFPLNTEPFKALISTITLYKDDESRKYPDYHQDLTNPPPTQPQTTVVPLEPLLDLCKTDPVLLTLTQTAIGPYEALKNELVPLKAANLAMISKKEVMIEKHDLHMRELLKTAKEFRLRVILEKVRFIYASMNWSTPIVHQSQCKNCPYDLAWYSPGGAQFAHAKYQEIVNKKLKKAEGLVKDLIATIEGFIEPKETK